MGALSAGSGVGHDLEAGYWRVSAFSAAGASSDALKQHQQNVPSSRRNFCPGVTINITKYQSYFTCILH